MAQYLPILVLAVLATLFAALSFAASRLLAPRNPTAAKAAPYECGIEAGREPPERFGVTFFLIAMIFIVFDIEIVFFLPWAIVHKELGFFGLAAIALFAALVFESFVYLIGNGALEWGPARRLRANPMVDPQRTTTSTVRRVGTEGREPHSGEAA